MIQSFLDKFISEAIWVWLFDSVPFWLLGAVLLLGLILLFGAVYIIAKNKDMYLGTFMGLFIALALIMGASFQLGHDANKATWKTKIAQVQSQLKAEKAQSKTLNSQLQDQIRAGKTVIERTNTVYRDRVKVVKERIDRACVVDPEVISIMNGAASGTK